MKSDLLQDAIGMIKDEYIIDVITYKRRSVKQKLFISALISTVCFCLIFAISFVFLNIKQKNDTLHTKTDEKIIWSGQLYISEGEDDAKETDYLTDDLKNALNQGNDNDIYAVVVSISTNVMTSDEYEDSTAALLDKTNAAEQTLNEVAQDCIDNMVSGGMSLTEAYIRIFKQQEFTLARQQYIDAKAEYTTARLTQLFNSNKTKAQYFEQNGFVILHTAKEKKYAPYLSQFHNGLFIISGTKKQILSIENESANFSFKLYSACKYADEYVFSDNYSLYEINIDDNKKISDKLIKEYEKAKDTTLDVIIKFAYFGKELSVEEIDALAYKAIGMTEQEFLEKATTEIVEQFSQERNKLIWHTEFYEEMVDKHLKNDEYIKTIPYSEEVHAKLSYERATELSKSNDVAYIMHNSEPEINQHTDSSIGFDE